MSARVSSFFVGKGESRLDFGSLWRTKSSAGDVRPDGPCAGLVPGPTQVDPRADCFFIAVQEAAIEGRRKTQKESSAIRGSPDFPFLI